MAALGIFTEISLVIVLAVVICSVIKFLRQPLIIGYIITGLIAGPILLDLSGATNAFATFSQIGIALLLFIVGIGLSPSAIKQLGSSSFLIGISQVLSTATIGLFLSLALGFPFITSLYIAIALTFSSTIIIMKLLSDKNALATLYGKLSIGLLLVQDFIAILILIAASTFSNGVDLPYLLVSSAVKGIALFALIFLIGYFLFPRLKNFLGDSQEYLFIFSLGWCLFCASLFALSGFSIEIGALLAGISLSISPFHFEISARVRPLRDFFIVLFFIYLGSQMTLGGIASQLVPVILLSLFILIFKPMVVMLIMGLMGYTKRSIFMMGITVGQISEFSLILVALGARLGHFGSEIMSLVTAVGLITIAGSTYMVLHAETLYSKFAPYISFLERKNKNIEDNIPLEQYDYEIILWGYNRIGFDLLKSLDKLNSKFLVIDFNPDTVQDLAKESIPCIYGDAADIELLDDLNFSRVKMVLSTIPDFDTNSFLIHSIRKKSKKAIIVVVSHDIGEAESLYRQGATYVLMPHFLGGYHMAEMIEKNKLSIGKYEHERKEHLKLLGFRKKKGQEHPKTPKGHN